MNKDSIPFYAKITIILVGLTVFVLILYAGSQIIVPLIYATIIAILLNPVVNFLTRKGLNRVISIAIALACAIIVLVVLVYFISSQVSRFAADAPQLSERFDMLLKQVTDWISSTFHISSKQVKQWMESTKSTAVENSGLMIGKTILTLSGAAVLLLLMPVYIFMILFYKVLLLEFLKKLFDHSQHDKVAEVLMETKGLIQSYLMGLLIEAGIVAVLNSAALLALGIRYAILLGIIGALLNIIPYIGGIIAVALPMIIALITKDEPSYALLVLAAYSVIQFADNNFFVPKIVASKVKINALVSIIAVLVGNALWGVPGMFLSIPLTAIIKVIFDRIENLKAWGFLLGDNMPHPAKIIFNFNRRKKRAG